MSRNDDAERRVRRPRPRLRATTAATSSTRGRAQAASTRWSSPGPKARTSGTATATRYSTSPPSWSSPTSATSTRGSSRPIQEQAADLCTVAPAYGNGARSEAARLIAERTPRTTSTGCSSPTAERTPTSTPSGWRALHTGKHKVLSTYRSYHGGTQLAVNVTGDPRRWANDTGTAGTVHFFGPFLYRRAFHATTERRSASGRWSTSSRSSRSRVPRTIAAIMLETIPGTAGIMVPPPGYLAGVRELCDQHGIMLIADEVMAGFGRAGEWFAIEHAATSCPTC